MAIFSQLLCDFFISDKEKIKMHMFLTIRRRSIHWHSARKCHCYWYPQYIIVWDAGLNLWCWFNLYLLKGSACEIWPGSSHLYLASTVFKWIQVTGLQLALWYTWCLHVHESTSFHNWSRGFEEVDSFCVFSLQPVLECQSTTNATSTTLKNRIITATKLFTVQEDRVCLKKKQHYWSTQLINDIQQKEPKDPRNSEVKPPTNISKT